MTMNSLLRTLQNFLGLIGFCCIVVGLILTFLFFGHEPGPLTDAIIITGVSGFVLVGLGVTGRGL